MPVLRRRAAEIEKGRYLRRFGVRRAGAAKKSFRRAPSDANVKLRAAWRALGTADAAILSIIAVRQG
ncbi:MULTISPECIES: hypothetical protein [Burkholderia]|uniref:hypothetical protein n=1 Tax=Burkholderia TaxID=32008 RepID=UPI0005722912|nr:MULTISPECIES: hypothetical protein [Burkholderia]AOJ71400.1 hypothetical protein WS78_21425 [Burkholderia savannae]AOK49798.1 hypothetical protein WT60_23235 [Burkholderia sp. MSMB617WGS]KVG79162.1 hypothetical protein WS81_15110 [Burkholderia sp. MSMB2040]KVK78551.1 hypothetical protein WS91_14900 [Burkholderia sp. MSMB1498]